MAKLTGTQRDFAILRAQNRAEQVADLRDGRRNRATTFTDRRKAAARTAARGRTFRGEW